MKVVNEIEILSNAVEMVKAKLLVDREYMEAAEIEEMQRTIRGLNLLISTRKNEEYVQQLKDFKDHMDKTIETYHGDDEALCEKFYNMEFTVIFNNKKVTLANGAQVFNDIYSCIEDEITEQQS